jgi:hypothetical protein
LEIFRWKKVTFNKITVLGFGGSSLENRGNLFNLNKKFTNVSYFQRRSVCDDLSQGTEINSIFDA